MQIKESNNKQLLLISTSKTKEYYELFKTTFQNKVYSVSLKVIIDFMQTALTEENNLLKFQLDEWIKN